MFRSRRQPNDPTHARSANAPAEALTVDRRKSSLPMRRCTPSVKARWSQAIERDEGDVFSTSRAGLRRHDVTCFPTFLCWERDYNLFDSLACSECSGLLEHRRMKELTATSHKWRLGTARTMPCLCAFAAATFCWALAVGLWFPESGARPGGLPSRSVVR